MTSQVNNDGWNQLLMLYNKCRKDKTKPRIL